MGSYSDEQRAEAVALLQAEGYPDKKGALTAVSERIGIPKETIRRWFRKISNPPDPKIVTEKRRELGDIINDEIYAILNVLPSKRYDAGYRELVTAFGILVDKMRLIGGDATERLEISTESAIESAAAEFERIIRNRSNASGVRGTSGEPDDAAEGGAAV